MAWTNSVIDKTVFGNKRVHVLSCTADAATYNVDTGLEVIDHFHISSVSLTTAALKCFKNQGAISTSLAGIVGVSGATSGDVFFLYAYGR